MGITGILDASNHISPKNGISSGQPAWDNKETGIRNEIKGLQEDIKKISKDDKLSAEQKAKQKQAIQEEIQSLNNELRQYQIQKRLEEAQKKLENAKPESANAEKTTGKEAEESQKVFGNEELGVIITISLSQNQVSNLEKVRKDLEGKHRTAGTEEEREKLQKKIHNVSKNIGQKMVITEDSIMQAQAFGKFGTVQGQGKEDSGKDDVKMLSGRKMLDNQDSPFGNVSFVIG